MVSPIDWPASDSNIRTKISPLGHQSLTLAFWDGVKIPDTSAGFASKMCNGGVTPWLQRNESASGEGHDRRQFHNAVLVLFVDGTRHSRNRLRRTLSNLLPRALDRCAATSARRAPSRLDRSRHCVSDRGTDSRLVVARAGSGCHDLGRDDVTGVAMARVLAGNVARMGIRRPALLAVVCIRCLLRVTNN